MPIGPMTDEDFEIINEEIRELGIRENEGEVMKFCKDCKHIFDVNTISFCYKSKFTDLVNGVERFQPCHTFRTFTLDNYCGPDAELFEAKE